MKALQLALHQPLTDYDDDMKKVGTVGLICITSSVTWYHLYSINSAYISHHHLAEPIYQLPHHHHYHNLYQSHSITITNTTHHYHHHYHHTQYDHDDHHHHHQLFIYLQQGNQKDYLKTTKLSGSYAVIVALYVRSTLN
jgi:hypothetical protein